MSPRTSAAPTGPGVSSTDARITIASGSCVLVIRRITRTYSVEVVQSSRDSASFLRFTIMGTRFLSWGRRAPMVGFRWTGGARRWSPRGPSRHVVIGSGWLPGCLRPAGRLIPARARAVPTSGIAGSAVKQADRAPRACSCTLSVRPLSVQPLSAVALATAGPGRYDLDPLKIGDVLGSVTRT